MRIYSISTTQQGREEDYESILDLVSACGGQIDAPLVKTEIPVPEPAPSSKPAARKSTKLVITAKELADLMSSLNFDGNDKTEIPEKEMSRWLADGVALKPHQLVAVAWMGEAEKGKFGGGILADDMGMVCLLFLFLVLFISSRFYYLFISLFLYFFIFMYFLTNISLG